MTKDEVVKILHNEETCVRAADNCGRDCANCHLVMDDKKILEAYEAAIDMIESYSTWSQTYSNMVEDVISRQAAIDALMAWEEGSVWDEECLKHRGEPYWVAPSDVIEQLPSAQPYTEDEIQKMQDLEQAQLDKMYELGKQTAQPEQRWIPCSERLPHGSCSDLVNVSIHDDSGDTPFDYTSCGWVTTDGEYWIVDNEINNHVVAWMPLPKPWRGEKH